MVVCETMAIPRPPALPPNFLAKDSGSFRSSQGFRLMEDQDKESVYSVYKQKIDSMFDAEPAGAKNSVQDRIEKMFSDVAIDGGIPVSEIGCHVFSIDYLGSVSLTQKVTSLAGLQDPLKELYFAYKKSAKLKQALTGRLEISAGGLKVQYQGEKGDLEQLNSFPTIAVWSAVKFVIQEEPKRSYAFLPLITDADTIDKQVLFRELDAGEKKYITSEAHSPLFAVVMRKIGVNKQLDCHGFVCQTSEDAIVIAATLYKSLMAHMKAKKPKNRNGVSCMSVSSSAYNEVASVPVRPPRKKRSTTSSVTSEKEEVLDAPLFQDPAKPKKSTKTKRAPTAPDAKEDPDAIVPYEEPTDKLQEAKPSKWDSQMTVQQRQIAAEIKQVISEGSNRGLRRVHSVRKGSDENALSKGSDTGDILTKVTIPRSGSFLNAGGLMRYKSKLNRTNGQTTGGSPLGFHELFNEFRLQEGLHSVDEILAVIIDPEGMSFNDLKPIYKEFLLKLSVTLTKDELYQRSKAIMRRHKKKLIRRNVQAHKHRFLIAHRFKNFRHIFRKSFKLGKRDKNQKGNEVPKEEDSKLPESSISTSSYDTRQFRPKTQLGRKQSYKKRRERTSTSEESDFSLRRSKSKAQFQANLNQNRNSSSGYVSCSECSYDSDTCTCLSADKCYCSLGQKNVSNGPSCTCNLGKSPGNSLSYCGCDTDSCADSNKCYCARGDQGTIFEQLKQRGFIPSTEPVVTPPNERKLCKKISNSKSTRSLEYMPNPCEKYYEKIRPKNLVEKQLGLPKKNPGLEYEMFRPVYGRTLSVPDRVPSLDSVRYSGRHYGRTLQSTAISSGACTEALSVKKSAEIAALFADIKLSQTTDITHLLPRDVDIAQLLNERAFKRILPIKNIAKMNEKRIQQNNRMVQNALYASKTSMKNNKMYSARNGLYTIQSQSDDSRRSSISEGRPKGEYFTIEAHGDAHKIPVSSRIENSLGYLP